MSAAWREFTIEQLKAESASSIAIGPFGSRMKSDTYVPLGVPVIRGNNLSESKRLSGDFVYISEGFADQLMSCNVREGDLVFPHRGNIGMVGLVGSEEERYVLSTSLMKLSCNKRLVDPLFLYYFFRSPAGRHELLKNASQVGTPGIATPLSSLRSINVRLPPLDEQALIASLLGSLDDKIDLNRRMNETLEAIARAIFRSWFVDFDPVRARMEGRPPHGMGAETASLFPDGFEDSLLGKVPRGWRVGRWNDLISLEYGKSLRGYENAEGPYTVFGTNGPIGKHHEPLCLHPGIIVGRKGAYRGVHFHDEPFYVIDTAYYVRPRDGLVLRWAYYQMLREDINGMDSGSAIPSTSREDFYRLPLVAPPRPVQEKFAEQLATNWKAQRNNLEQSQTLAALRDSLLPKLLSGEIRLKEAETIMEST
jgi:type I restriction enzyme S subunit